MAYVLIVDDDDDFATATATVISNAGYETEVKLSINGARESLKKRCPDLLILDVMFPENSNAGFEFSREIRKSDDSFKSVPILLLTAINQEFPLGFSVQDIDESWMPVEDFLEKPIDFDVLCSKVASMLTSEST